MFRWLQKLTQTKSDQQDNLSIREGVHGTFYYHVAKNGKPLCGTSSLTMETCIPLKSWGIKTHLNERYCSKCDELLGNERVG